MAALTPLPRGGGAPPHRDWTMLEKKLHWRTAAATLAATLTLLAACQKKEAPAPVQAPPIEVKVTASRSETVPVVNEYVGRIAAYRSVEVRARVEGIIEKRHYVEGADVKRGDLLYPSTPPPTASRSTTPRPSTPARRRTWPAHARAKRGWRRW